MSFHNPLQLDGQGLSVIPADISDQIAAFLTPENEAENDPYREQISHTYYVAESAGNQGASGTEHVVSADTPSYLGYCESSETVLTDGPAGTDDDAKDDDRQIGIRRRAVRSVEVTAYDDHHAHCGAHHADRILSRPLNWMLTLNLPAIREAAPMDRAPMWKETRDTLRRFFKRNGEAFTYVFNRASIDKHASGEHAHMLLHCPKSLTKRLKDFVLAEWGSPAAHLQPARRDTRPKTNGRLQSALNYTLQGVSWCRAERMGRYWHYGGTIYGLRTTWSTDIGPKAIQAYKNANGIVSAA